MNEANSLRTYFGKQLNTIEIILKKRHRKISKVDIHKLRIAVKKIKAVSALVLFFEPGFKRKKFLKSFKKIFRAAGKLREVQLEISRLKKLRVFDSLNDYSHHLKKLLKKKKHVFFSLANGRLRRKLKKRSKMILPYFEGIDKNRVNWFLEEKSNEISKLMESRNLKQSEAHSLRKKLKEFSYLIAIFGVKDKRFDKIDELQELLGKWHNDVVLKDYLEKAVDNEHQDKKELKIISGTKEKISFESELLFEKIKAGTHNIDSSLLKIESRSGMLRQPEP